MILVFIIHKTFSKKLIFQLTSSCKNLRSVSTIGCRKLYGEGLIELFKQNSKNLLSLNISHCPNLSSAVLQVSIFICGIYVGVLWLKQMEYIWLVKVINLNKKSINNFFILSHIISYIFDIVLYKMILIFV